jgi:DNA-directed RNA polymerase specialized sigma24 family protein
MNDSHRDLDRLRELLLVREAQQGQAEAFRTLVDAYERRLLYFIRRILGEEDRSLDVLQDVWLTVIKRLSSLQSAESMWCAVGNENARCSLTSPSHCLMNRRIKSNRASRQRTSNSFTTRWATCPPLIAKF